MTKKILLIILIILIIVFIGIIIYVWPSLYPVLGPTPEKITDSLPKTNLNQPQQNSSTSNYPNLTNWQTNKQGPLTILGDLQISVFAEDLDRPRVLLFDNQGNLLVSAMNEGAVYAIKPDKTKIKLINGLNSPHGLELKDGYLYIAEPDQVNRYAYNINELKLSPAEKLFDLPDNRGIHYTRTLKFGQDGNLYVSVGSSCNVCYEKDERRSAILQYDPDDWTYNIFASGLRNTVFFVQNQKTGNWWGNDMGRDWLGDNLPPDELNIIEQGKNYGWPLCYGEQVHDTDFDKNIYEQNPCKGTEPMVWGYPAHFSPLGLVFIDSPIFPKEWQGDILSSLHGSWNRSQPGGYKVVHLTVDGEEVTGTEDFITGFLTDQGAIGRPVDLVFGPDQALYLSDDKAGVIYKIN